MIKLSRKVIFFWQLKEIVWNFRMQENTSLQMKNFNIFQQSMPPDLGKTPATAFPILCQYGGWVSLNPVALLVFKTLMTHKFFLCLFAYKKFYFFQWHEEIQDFP